MKLIPLFLIMLPVWATSRPSPSLLPTQRGLATRGGGAFGGLSTPKQRIALPTTTTTKDRPKDTVAAAFPPGTASIPAEIFNLIKLIVGAGVLGLPAGIAAFGNHPTALVPALILFCIIGSLAAYGFALIGAVCAATRARSYRQAWRDTVGDASSWLPALACLLVTSCSVLTNSMIQADTIPSIIKAFTGIQVSRTTALLGVTSIVLLPLCLMRQLKSLAPFSLVGIFGMMYTSTVMMYRWMSNSYGKESSTLLTELAPHLWPKFGSQGWMAIFSPNAAILVAMLSSCECCVDGLIHIH